MHFFVVFTFLCYLFVFFSEKGCSSLLEMRSRFFCKRKKALRIVLREELLVFLWLWITLINMMVTLVSDTSCTSFPTYLLEIPESCLCAPFCFLRILVVKDWGILSDRDQHDLWLCCSSTSLQRCRVMLLVHTFEQERLRLSCLEDNAIKIAQNQVVSCVGDLSTTKKKDRKFLFYCLLFVLDASAFGFSSKKGRIFPEVVVSLNSVKLVKHYAWDSLWEDVYPISGKGTGIESIPASILGVRTAGSKRPQGHSVS